MGITVYKSTVRLGGLVYEATGDGGGLEIGLGGGGGFRLGDRR